MTTIPTFRLKTTMSLGSTSSLSEQRRGLVGSRPLLGDGSGKFRIHIVGNSGKYCTAYFVVILLANPAPRRGQGEWAFPLHPHKTGNMHSPRSLAN